MSDIIVDLIWKGTDLLNEDVLSQVNFDQKPEQLERSLGYILHNRIDELCDKALPFIVVHEPPDFEFLKDPRARPPQPDLGFVMRGYDRVIWPVEMKILGDDQDVQKYADEVRENFLTGRYASFTGEGAMLGYMLSGSPDNAYANIAREVPCQLKPGSHNPPRHHMLSDHLRTVPEGEGYLPYVRCHHMLLILTFGNL